MAERHSAPKIGWGIHGRHADQPRPRQLCGPVHSPQLGRSTQRVRRRRSLDTLAALRVTGSPPRSNGLVGRSRLDSATKTRQLLTTVSLCMRMRRCRPGVDQTIGIGRGPIAPVRPGQHDRSCKRSGSRGIVTCASSFCSIREDEQTVGGCSPANAVVSDRAYLPCARAEDRRYRVTSPVSRSGSADLAARLPRRRRLTTSPCPSPHSSRDACRSLDRHAISHPADMPPRSSVLLRPTASRDRPREGSSLLVGTLLQDVVVHLHESYPRGWAVGGRRAWLRRGLRSATDACRS